MAARRHKARQMLAKQEAVNKDILTVNEGKRIKEFKRGQKRKTTLLIYPIARSEKLNGVTTIAQF